MSNGLDPRYSPAVLEEDQPTLYELLGGMIAPGLAAAIATYERTDPLAGPSCRPCKTPSCFHVSLANIPYCAPCQWPKPRRPLDERRAMAKAAAR